MFDLGFVVGKFCPLHRGHQLLLDEARRQSKRLIILSYTSEDYGYTVEQRRRWIKKLYPEALSIISESFLDDDADESLHRELCAQVCERLNLYPNAVFTSEEYGDGLASHFSKKWGVEVAHVQVDLKRKQIPISGTELRSARFSDRELYERYTNPIVHSEPVQRILLIGGESSGKTTLARALAQRTDCYWVPEFGRIFGESMNQKYLLSDMSYIAQCQVDDENTTTDASLKQQKPFVFCDTSPLVTRFYSEKWFGKVDSTLTKLSHREYHKVFLCVRDFEFADDGTRSGEEFSNEQEQYYRSSLNQQYIELRGSIENRIEKVLKELNYGLA